MSVRNDEQHETGADEQEHGHPKKPKRSRRWVLLVVVLSVAALAWSCVFHGKLTRKPVGFLATNDAVIALRLGRGWTTVLEDKPYYDGWIVLLDAQGRGQVASVDEIDGGDVLWSERGVFYGSPSWDYVTTDAGTSVIKDKFWGRYDVQRYELSDGALVAVQREYNDYRIGTLFPDGTHASVETDGVGRGIGQCGGRIVAITTTEKSESIKSAAFEAYAAQSGGSVPEALEVVVQLNDFDGDVPPVLAVAPRGMSSRCRACGRTRTTPRPVAWRASGEAWFFSGGTCLRGSVRLFPWLTRLETLSIWMKVRVSLTMRQSAWATSTGSCRGVGMLSLSTRRVARDVTCFRLIHQRMGRTDTWRPSR